MLVLERMPSEEDRTLELAYGVCEIVILWKLRVPQENLYSPRPLWSSFAFGHFFFIRYANPSLLRLNSPHLNPRLSSQPVSTSISLSGLTVSHYIYSSMNRTRRWLQPSREFPTDWHSLFLGYTGTIRNLKRLLAISKPRNSIVI